MSAVDVLIPTCERAAALAVTLTSLGAQTFRDFRVVVSDQSESGDAAAAGEVQAARRVLEAHGCEVEMLKHLPRRGIAEQRDFLLGRASSPLVLYLDDDLILEPFVIRLLVDAIERERCGFVGSACIGLSFIDDVRPHEQEVAFWDGPVAPETIVPGDGAWRRAQLHNAANLLHVQRGLRIEPRAPRLYRVAWVSACVLFDREKLRSLGGFSFWSELPQEHCGEDVLVQLRMLREYGGAGIMPSGVYHQELPTTIPDRRVDAPRELLARGRERGRCAGSV
ncbi:MAG TPA: glycosyltransferase family A protein [Gammaproteobacteria bacterium]|nr:glycosyltransferase family A protein [Gammaproteobacteria bacterium]